MIRRNGLIQKKALVAAVSGILIIVILFMFFPFGYSLQEDGNGKVTISENGILRNEFTVEVTEANELTIVLLKSVLKEFKTICIILLIIFPLLLLSLAFNYVQKSKGIFIIMCVISIFMMIAITILYFNNIEIMENLIKSLSQKKK